MSEAACPSCDVVAGRLRTPGDSIYADEYWSLTHSTSPVQLPGFLILQPIRHVEHVADLSSAEAAAMGPLLSGASRALMKVLAPEKIYVCSFGSAVKHVHFYLMPRIPEMPDDLLGAAMVSEVFTGRWACSDEEAADVAARVRVELAKDPFL